MKTVQLPYDIYVSLLRFHVMDGGAGTYEDHVTIKHWLEEKQQRLADHENYMKKGGENHDIRK